MKSYEKLQASSDRDVELQSSTTRSRSEDNFEIIKLEDSFPETQSPTDFDLGITREGESSEIGFSHYPDGSALLDSDHVAFHNNKSTSLKVVCLGVGVVTIIFGFLVITSNMGHNVVLRSSDPVPSSSASTFQAPSSSSSSRPSDFHCEFDEETCQNALKAHPVWQQEALEAIKHSWDGYGNSEAFGKDAVDVVTGKVGQVWVDAGVFMIDSLSTLWLAGLHDEFDRCVAHIREVDWSRSRNENHSFFEITIRLLGGLLGAYDLSGEKVLLTKAVELADILLNCFSDDSPFPHPRINLATGARGWDWRSRGNYGLAEIGSFQMEFLQLSYHTGDSKYKTIADKAMAALMSGDTALITEAQKLSGGVSVNADSHLTMGGNGDSYFEYLLKIYIQTGCQDTQYLREFEQVYEEAVQKLQVTTEGGHFTYWDDVKNGRHSNNFEHLTCFIGGTLALGHYHNGEKHPEWQHTATELAQTCREMYTRTKTGLAGELVRMDPNTPDINQQVTSKSGAVGILRPEAVESWFYLHYFTGDPKYRQWAHEYLVALNEHARAPFGYSTVRDVNNLPATHTGFCESFVMAETLKYLYLIMSDRSKLDLSQYVFNTEAHPLKIHDREPSSDSIFV